MNSKFRKLSISLSIILVYIICGRLGLHLASINSSTTAVWAPTGIALASLLYFGVEYWPSIFIGAFFVNFLTTSAVISSLAIAIGNTLEGLIGALLVNRYACGKEFYRTSLNVKKFVFFAAVIATAVSATVGVLTLITSGIDSWQHIALAWSTWWIGDAAGAIVITPLLLVLFNQKLKKLERPQIFERIIFILFLVGGSFVVFGKVFENHPLGFLLIPLLVWPGLRFSQKESVIATFTVTSIAISATILGYGPFVSSYPTDTLLMLQAYICVICSTSLVLAASVAERIENEVKLALAYELALEGWSNALDLRDKETEGHSRRVADLTVKLAHKLGLRGKDLVNIRRGALLHDIGKMGIPDSILFKHGPLTEDEMSVMQKHPEHGNEFLSRMSYFDPARLIAFCHHEKWDGTGYPRGLKADEIPLHARIFAVVDVFDALGSNRAYRTAWPHEKIIDHMVSLSGRHFDPQILDVFVKFIAEEVPIAEPGVDEVVQLATFSSN